MKSNKKDNHGHWMIVSIIALVTLISFVFGLLIGNIIASGKVTKEFNYLENSVPEFSQKEKSNLEANEVMMKIPAVGKDGKGVLGNLSVEIRKGTGMILVNINNILAGYDTQYSARLAAEQASEFTGIDIKDYDIIYKINAESPLVSGASAGAAMAIGTIAGLEEKELKDDVIITGTINPGGIIGQISGVLAKGEAAKENGINTFLVPMDQGTEVIYGKEQKCNTRGGFKFCNTYYVPETVDIANELGIKVVEVRNLEDALKYFIQ